MVPWSSAWPSKIYSSIIYSFLFIKATTVEVQALLQIPPLLVDPSQIQPCCSLPRQTPLKNRGSQVLGLYLPLISPACPFRVEISIDPDCVHFSIHQKPIHLKIPYPCNCLQDLTPEGGAQALEASHAVYEDCKLHVLRWALLGRLGATLVQLASLLGAPRYVDHYLRDLGPACLTSAASALLSQVSRRPC